MADYGFEPYFNVYSKTYENINICQNLTREMKEFFLLFHSFSQYKLISQN